MTPGDWIGIATLISASLAASLAAYWQSRRPRRGADDDNPDGESRVLALTPEDRAILTGLRDALNRFSLSIEDRRTVAELRDVVASLRDALFSLGRRLDASTDALAESRRAINDATDALQKRRS